MEEDGEVEGGGEWGQDDGRREKGGGRRAGVGQGSDVLRLPRGQAKGREGDKERRGWWWVYGVEGGFGSERSLWYITGHEGYEVNSMSWAAWRNYGRKRTGGCTSCQQ